ncbi:SDR family NAD(P)-dependent oxidoreductase, partial [Candidatus Bathyarchaeota archaeon]
MSSANMTGKICIVTGGNSGIGKATAIGLAKMGATVVIVSRSREKGEIAVNDIVGKSGNKNVEMIQADMSSQDSIRQLADEFKAKHE